MIETAEGLISTVLPDFQYSHEQQNSRIDHQRDVGVVRNAVIVAGLYQSIFLSKSQNKFTITHSFLILGMIRSSEDTRGHSRHS